MIRRGIRRKSANGFIVHVGERHREYFLTSILFVWIVKGREGQRQRPWFIIQFHMKGITSYFGTRIIGDQVAGRVMRRSIKGIGGEDENFISGDRKMKKQCKNPECPLPNREFETNRSKVDYCSRPCNNKDKQRVRMEGVKEWQVLSCGGGVQSTAMIAMIYSGELPKPDLVLMVDTGYEKHGTLDYASRVLIPACNKIGIEFKFLNTPDNRIFNASGMIVLPAFKKMEDGSTQRLYTMCSGTWKVALMRQYLRSIGVKKAVSWIGISTDESQRQRQSNLEWISNRYPLVEKDVSRYRCLYLIRSLGWPDPARSSCIMCPLQGDAEFELMKSEYPDDYQRVVDMDNQIEKYNPNVFLHRSFTRMRDIIWECDVLGRIARMPAVPCEICQ